MRQRLVSLIIHASLSILFSLFLLFAVSLRAAAQTPTLDAEEQAFLTLINNYRAQNGVGPLKASIALTNAAKWMSNDMASNNYFSHTDSLGRSPFTRMAAFNYGYSAMRSENVAGGNSTATATFNQWKSSPGHNQSMLNPNFKVIGIGRAFGAGSTYRWYWTTDFGSFVDATLDSSSAPPATTTTINTVNGASFTGTIAPDAIAVSFGSNLAAGIFAATTMPLPTNLGGIAVTINGVAARLLYVSPSQINFVVPSSVSAGAATVTISRNGTIIGIGTATVRTVSPSIFTFSANGQGVPAGFTTFDSVFYSPIYNANGSAQPLSVGTTTNPNYLILFGTGFRLRTSVSNVQVLIGGVAATVEYAGPQSSFAGLDQLNVKLPVSLRGRGEVPLVLIVDGQVANSVRINIGN